MLARHPENVEGHGVADDVLHIAVEHRGRQKTPPLALCDSLTHQGASGDDALLARQGAAGELPAKDRGETENQHQRRWWRIAHPLLEVHAYIDWARNVEHVGGDANRLLVRGRSALHPAHPYRRSPVSSITPSANPSRRSRSRRRSAERSSTYRSRMVGLRLNSPTTMSLSPRVMRKFVRRRPNSGPSTRRRSDRMIESSFATYITLPVGDRISQRLRKMLYR